MKENANLIININVISITPITIPFIYKKNSLENLDRETLNYQNEEEYFLKNKKNILNKLKLEVKKYNLEAIPYDISLNEIWIENNHKKIQALFSNIKIKDQYIPLETIIKRKLWQGNLEKIYHIDKKFTSNSKYISIFENFNAEQKDLLEQCYMTPNLVNYFWEYILSQDCFYLLVRIFLLNTSNDIYNNFISRGVIEMRQEKIKEDLELKRRYRLPFKDDDE